MKQSINIYNFKLYIRKYLTILKTKLNDHDKKKLRYVNTNTNN